MNTLEVRNLRKVYPAFTLQDVSFTVPAGSVTGLVGRNGAGKSTLLRLIAGVLRADRGQVCVDGNDVQAVTRQSLRSAYGMVLQDTWLKCHVDMFEYFGGVPIKITCDNLKTGVIKHPKEGEIVLNEVVVPEFIVVHDGLPNDPSAQNYYVRFTDYIKNVASSEIYATWPEATIYANILAIMSFTLNRVYTEFYRSQ